MNNKTTKDSFKFFMYRICSILCPVLSIFFLYIVWNSASNAAKDSDGFMLLLLVLGLPMAMLVIAITIGLILFGFFSAYSAYEVDKDDIISKIIYFIYIGVAIIVGIAYGSLFIFGALAELNIIPK